MNTASRAATNMKARTLSGIYVVDTKKFGMWVFLAMEMLFFASLFFLFGSQRYFYPDAFSLGSQNLDVWLGTLNTAVLLTSSLTMALAVQWLAQTQRERAKLALFATALLGMVFLGIKTYEYVLDYRHALIPGLRFSPAFKFPKEMVLFFSLYFLGTSLHALHLLIGILWASTLGLGLFFKRFEGDWLGRVAVLGLYWHFVDIVWIFLFPVFYLGGTH